MSRVFKHMYEKTEYNLDYLVCFFTRTIILEVISFTVKQFDFQLFEKCSPKLTKEF